MPPQPDLAAGQRPPAHRQAHHWLPAATGHQADGVAIDEPRPEPHRAPLGSHPEGDRRHSPTAHNRSGTRAGLRPGMGNVNVQLVNRLIRSMGSY